MSACSRPVPNCPDCADVLIHQTNRGPHESSSAFGQYIHDRGLRDGGRWLQMFWMDVDGVLYKNATRILRVIEHKPVGGQLSKGQLAVLPLIAKSVQILAATGLIHRESGVFLLHSDPPHNVITVEQIKGWQQVSVQNQVELMGSRLESFLLGEPIDSAPSTYKEKIAQLADGGG